MLKRSGIFGFLGMATTVVVSACSGGSPSGTPSGQTGDGGRDATPTLADASGTEASGDTGAATPTDSGGGGTQDTGTGNTGSGAVAAFCAKANAYYNQCGGADACTTAELAECTTFFAQFNPTFIAAVDSCVTTPFVCTEGGAGGDNNCAQDALAGIKPDAAQTKVKTGFCALCPDGKSPSTPDSCSGFFESTDAGTAFGEALLELNDSVANQIDTNCLSGSIPDAGVSDCEEAFDLCALPILQNAFTEPAVCQTDGG
jgi:hypothetical protein